MFARRFKHRFNGRQVLPQSVLGSSVVSEPDNYKLAASVSLDTELNGQWVWRVSGECHYENQPASGRDQRDLLVASSRAYKF